MYHVKKARVEGIGTVFPKQMRDFSYRTFQSENGCNYLTSSATQINTVDVLSLQQGGQRDNRC